MHYTARVCHALQDKFSMAQTMNWTLLGCAETLTALGRRWCQILPARRWGRKTHPEGGRYFWGTSRISSTSFWIKTWTATAKTWFVIYYMTRFAMHYTAVVCHALHCKGLPCITRQGFVMHYTTTVYCTLLTNKFSVVQTVHRTLLGCVQTLTALGRRWCWCCLRWLRLYRRGGEIARHIQKAGDFLEEPQDSPAPLSGPKHGPPRPRALPATLGTAGYFPDKLAHRGPMVNISSQQPGFRVYGVFLCWTL